MVGKTTLTMRLCVCAKGRTRGYFNAIVYELYFSIAIKTRDTETAKVYQYEQETYLRRRWVLKIDFPKSVIVYACVKLPIFRQKSKQLRGLNQDLDRNGAKHDQA